ncbi:DUF2341 domain-containing protein [Nocardioides sp. W7]|uniref:DUF2341 domain-containing protein n=1 Tax=Nocardioides sp. W7 TaxID=2931390 RepID=UPI001FD5E668|nr:DUF2341 domain-containing protein [Nocardioides sp. W7]
MFTLSKIAVGAGLVGSLVAGSFVPLLIAAPPASAALDLDGEGTARSPYQIANVADLDLVADSINADPGQYAGRAYRLTADIPFAGATFEGINTFTGTFDGAGHTISDIVYGASPSGTGHVGFFRTVTGAAIKNLTLDGVTADNGTGTGWVSGLAVVAIDSILTGNAVVDATLSAPNGEKVGGLLAELQAGTVSDNFVSGSITAAKLPGGIASYAKNTYMFSNNLTDADLTAVTPGGANGTRGVDAAYVLAYPGTPSTGTLTGNVALNGSITYTGKVDGFAGRIAGYTGLTGWTASNNLADGAITVGGTTVTGPGTANQHGTGKTTAELAQQATYTALGWDFSSSWRWDATRQHPMPAYAASLFGSGTEVAPFEISSAEDLEFLAAQLTAGTAKYTGAKYYVLTGDLDFAGRAAWQGINTFSGFLDGAGHTVANLTYAARGTDTSLGLIRTLAGGVVENLTLRGVTANNGTVNAAVAGIAVVANAGARIEGNSVLGATLTANSTERAFGIAGEAQNNVTIINNWVDATASAKGFAGGVVGYFRYGVTVKNNLVQGSYSSATAGGTAGTRGVDPALVAAYPGTFTAGNPASTVTGNVALSGSVGYSGKVDGFAGRIVGYTGYPGWSASNNLANQAITIGGATVTGPGTANQHGTDKTAAELAQQATYEAIGWDFASSWRWDATLGHPVPKYVTAAEVPNRITTTFHGDPSTRRAFTWYSDTTATDVVARLSTDREFPEGAATVDVVAAAESSEDGEQLFRVVAEGLTPGQTYYYRLGSVSEQLWSTTGTFVTPTGDDEDFTFIDLTDTQATSLAEAQLSASTMAKSLRAVPEAEFMMHTGDIVEHGDVEQEWSDLLGAAAGTLTSTTLAPASGNHDAATNAFSDHFTLDTPNGQSTATGAYYSYDYNNAHFMVLNTNESAAQGISAAQLAWLEADARAAKAAGADWLILSLHKGLYTPATHLDDADVMAMRDVLVPVIDEVGIDLVLQGHDHVISRTEVLASDPQGVEGARVVETSRFTETVNGKRIEYVVDPDGTIYYLPGTAGAKHYDQATAPGGGIDLEAYLGLFDRLPDPAADRETFLSVRVTPDRLTVEQYDIRGGTSPRLFEGFGIDRQLSPVDDRLAALPAPGEITLDDAAAVADARAVVAALTIGQQEALEHGPKLTNIERRLRELQGLVSADGSVVAWADPAASTRQQVTVRNTTRTPFSDVPVQVRLTDTANVTSDQLAFFGADGAPLPFEVETWQPGGTSVVWVKVPALAKQSATVLWAYFGGGSATNDPAAVWSDGYSLVDHMTGQTTGGGQRPDSTGLATGTLRGGALAASVSSRGTSETRFDASRLEYPGNIGGDYDKLTVSGLYTFTAADVAQFSGTAPVIAKESAIGTDGAGAFAQAVRTDNKVTLVLKGNSYEFADVDSLQQFALPADGRPHLVTQTYDGMTYSVFIDGREVYSNFLEYRTTYGDPRVLTTIGDRYRSDGALASPFHGLIDEVQITGTAFTPEFESFRHANLLGDAVQLGDRVARSEEQVTLVIGTPTAGTATEAGLVDVAGSVSRRSVITASIGGVDVWSDRVDAGLFEVKVPVNVTGNTSVTFTATAVVDQDDTSEPVTVGLKVTDSAAPNAPLVSDDSATPGVRKVTLEATPQADDREQVEARFFAGEVIDPDGGGVVVRTGTTTDRVPTALTPSSGQVDAEVRPTTVGDNRNPFQIYELSLTPEQAAEDRFHFTWQGNADDRRVSAWVWDAVAGAWILKDDTSSAAGSSVALDVDALASEHAVADGKVRVLIWRGLTTLPWGSGHDFTQPPEGADFDWGLDHVGDTQLYTQATPNRLEHQLEYVVDAKDDRKTQLMVQAGDWVNREYYSQEYQWQDAEAAMNHVEEAGLPYLISWGNHDYSNERNGRVMLPRYYPMSRFEASLEGSPWSFGGSNGIDNYYYLGEISGAKLLVLTVGNFSADNASDAGIVWAKQVIASHPDHTVILATHNVVGGGTNSWTNSTVTTQLIAPYDNVRLVLGGHIAGTGIATSTNVAGRRVYGVLTDYQGRVYGGQEFMKHIGVDAENGLLYFNTFSPMLEARESSGGHHQTVSEGAVPGFHGSDTENYVVELDLGSHTTRSLATEEITFSAGGPVQVGETQQLVGAETASVVLDVEPGVAQEWYAEVLDGAGHTTRSRTSVISVGAPEPQFTAVTGSVSGPGGPVAGACAYLYRARDAAAASYASCTDASGGFVIPDVALGSYVLAVADPSGAHETWWSPEPVVVDGAQGAVPVTLTRGSVSASGVVSDGAGVVADACVYLYASPEASSAAYATCVDATGSWWLGGIAAGDYTVAVADPSGAHDTWWSTGPVSIDGAQAPLLVQLVAARGAVAGVVTGSAGAPVGGACAYVYAPGVTASASYASCAQADGSYYVDEVASGDWQVAFFDPSATYATQWWTGAAGGAADRAGAGVVGVDHALVPGIDAALTPVG